MALKATGLSALADRHFADLSDGEKQKAQIARAVAQDTDLLVFDEPTAFLDAPSRIEVFHLASRLAREGGKAIVLCTHEVDLALRYADVLWVFDRKHRFESGTPSGVALSGIIGRAFDTAGVRFNPETGIFEGE
jgi:iron complex transport system ATP-binding protein